MRIANVIFAGSVVALTALTTPALAKHTEAPKPADEDRASSPCHAYQMGPNGWTQLPCQEAGATSQPQRKSATRGPAENDAR